jgi:ribonuclease-3
MTDGTREWAETALGHRFKEPELIERALTHPSTGRADYQRLEFLGDRVLGIAIAEWLYDDFADAEGALTRRLVELVSGEVCAEVARAIGAEAHVRLGRQARQDGVKHSDNVLGDVCEALIGALWLDGGWEAAKAFVRTRWAQQMVERREAPKHPKSELQEWANGRGLPTPVYEIVGRTGAHHAPVFNVRVTVKGHEPAEAEGGNKQEAERAAAALMLERLRV